MPICNARHRNTKKYHDVASPNCFQKIEANTKQTVTLQKLRDTLLPCLLAAKSAQKSEVKNMPKFYESEIEKMAIEELMDLGYTYPSGPDIAPDTPFAERKSYGEALLRKD